MFQFKFCCLKMSSFSLPFISFCDSLSLVKLLLYGRHMSKARFRKRFRFYSENTKLLMQLTHHLKTSKVSIYMIIIIYLFLPN